jgi:hypothetical protein
MKTQKTGTPDLREKLTNDMVAKVVKICKGQGLNASKTLVAKHVNCAIDQYIDDWYEVSLEAMDLMEGGADFVTDEEVDDPEVIREVKLRVIKNMYEERPDGVHEKIAKSVMEDTDSQVEEVEEVSQEVPEKIDQIIKTEKKKTPAKKKGATHTEEN